MYVYDRGVLSPQMKMKRIEEAKSYSEAATNHLKTSMFKWSVDYLAAAPLFEKSAESYALANEFDMARLMYEKGAQAHEAYGSLSSAAMAFVKAAKIASQVIQLALSNKPV